MVVRRVAVATDQTPDSGKDGGFYADLDASRRRHSCIGCGGILSILGVLALLLFAGVVTLFAATGYVRVPLVSEWVYGEPPQPRRIVEPAHTGGIMGLVQAKATTLGSTGGTVVLTESELTGALREPNSQGELLLKQAQVSIDAQSVELYGQTNRPGSDQPISLRVYLAPSPVNDGQLVLSELYVGKVSVPLQYARSVVQFFLGIDVGTTEPLSAYGVQSLSLGAGTVTLALSSNGFSLDNLTPNLTLGTLAPESIVPSILPSTEGREAAE